MNDPGVSFVQEQVIIQQIGAILGNPKALSDDAFYDAERRLILTTDLLIEGQHFDLGYFSAADVGWKAAAVNLSDIAAMGGAPLYLLVSIGVPSTTQPELIQGLYQGLNACAQQFKASIVGGDTVASEHLVINVTAVGLLPEGHTLGERCNARAGDRVIVSGPHGLSAAGLHVFQQHSDEHSGTASLKQRHLRPQPRVQEGLLLSRQFTRYALMDSSDGLGDALLKMATASGVDIEIQESQLPQDSALEAYATDNAQNALHWALYGGEDFELVATIPSDRPVPEGFYGVGQVLGAADAGGNVWVHKIEGPPIQLESKATYQHFQ